MSVEFNKQQERVVSSSMEITEHLCISQFKVSSSSLKARGLPLPHAKMAGVLFKSHRHSVCPEDGLRSNVEGSEETWGESAAVENDDSTGPNYDTIEVIEAEEKTAGGLLLTETTKEKPSIGTGRAVGPVPLDEEGKRQPLSKYAGNVFKAKTVPTTSP